MDYTLKIRNLALCVIGIFVPLAVFAAPADFPIIKHSNRKATRAEALEMILKATGKIGDFEAPKTRPFRDVPEGTPFASVIFAGKQFGIARGFKHGKFFRPNMPITLPETLRMLFEAAEIQTSQDTSKIPPGISEHEWYTKDLAYAVSRSLVQQQEDGAIFPLDKPLTRGQINLLLYRFLEIQEGSNFGFASWYGDGLAKTKIDRGMEYKEKNLTAAHLELPFGTLVRVTNMENGKEVTVVVNDRGPYVTGRIIDLSKTAFASLAPPSTGIISVKIEVAEE